jgi:hypothetical protein
MNTDAVINSPHYPALVKFIEGVNRLSAEYWARNNFTYNTAPVVMVSSVGKRYAKLAKMERRPHLTGPLVATSVYCFCDLVTGDLLKGTWKAPVANGIRGNLTDPNVLTKFSEHGPKYLR